MAARRQYLYIAFGQLIAVREQRKRRELVGVFASGRADTQNDSERFEQHLAHYASDEFALLVDAVEEEHQIESVPKLRGRDLRALVQRRIEQRFRDQKLIEWAPIEEDAGRFKFNWRGAQGQMKVRISALHSDQALQPWLAILERSKAKVIAVKSPLLLSDRLTKMSRAHGDGLLVSVLPAGLRQTLIVGGHARFSRLAVGDSLSGIATIEAECLRTIQYLLMAQIIHREFVREGKLRLWLVADGIDDAERMPAEITIDNSSRMQVELIRGSLLGCTPIALPSNAADASSYTERLGRHGLAALPLWLSSALFEARTPGYAHTALRRFADLANRQRALFQFGSAALACSVVALAGIEVWDRVDYRDEWVKSSVVRETVEQKTLEQEMAAYPARGDEMRRVVELSEQLRRRSLDSEAVLSQVSQALAVDDILELSELTWARGALSDLDSGASAGGGNAPGNAGAGPSGPSGPSGSGGPGGGMIAGPAAPGGAAATGSAHASANASTPGKFGQAPTVAAAPAANNSATGASTAVRIKGKFNALVAMAQANDKVRQFASRLSASCGCTAQVTALPFDPGPEKSYTGSVKPSDERRRASFVIELVIPDQEPGTVANKPSVPNG